MGQHILPGNPPVEVILRRSARAKRISLRISQLDGRVTLTLPKGVGEQEGLAFAQEKEAWLRSHLDGRGDDVALGFGAEIPVEGALRRIVPATGKRIVLSETDIAVPGEDAQVGTRLAAFLKQMARDRLVAASDRYAGILGKPYHRITLRDTRSRWGSCSSAGALMYSWRLILCPPEVLDYVAGHEVAHLAEMNHSSAFWDTVTRIHGPYVQQRAWLRNNGSSLHRFRF
jgi:predicted metal-dependent hydrolase